MPLKRCNNSQCRNLVAAGVGYCPEHNWKKKRTPVDQEKQRERQRQYDALRGSAHQRGYGARWRTLADNIRRERGTCESCGKPPALVGTLHVHHLIPKSEGGADTRENLVALCHDCHNAEHHRFEKSKQFR